MKAPYKKRINKLKRALKVTSSSSAIILSSNPQRKSSADQHYSYRPNSDLYYFTGLRAEDIIFIVFAGSRETLIIAPEKNALKELWDGAPEKLNAAANRIGARLLRDKNQISKTLESLKGVETLYFDNNPGSASNLIAQKLSSKETHVRGKTPSEFIHYDTIVSPLRLKKDSFEIKQIKHAIDSTLAALDEIMPYIATGMTEYEIAASLEYWFRIQRCEVGFSSIVAAGASGAALHYNPFEVEYREGRGSKKLKKNDSVLIDCGASWGMYNADVTRVFPAGERFTDIQRDIYAIVLESQKKAISKIKHGVKVATVYKAAAEVLTQGLKDLGVLKGTVSKLMEKEAYKKYFPHSIGHSLGLDVHDMSNHRGNNDAILEEGMVFTIEPGLYFPKKVGKVPACGFRIEEDVLVKKEGCEVLTKDIPNEIDEVEAWHGNAIG